MSESAVIRISPPLTMDEIKDGPELRTIELIHLREPGEPFPSAEPWTANTIDYADGATRYLEIRNISPGQPSISRYVMRDRLVVRLDPFIGWPPMQADGPSEDGLMDILRDPDAVVSVSGLVAGYATDVWETVPADDTSLPEKLLAWRDAAVQRALATAVNGVRAHALNDIADERARQVAKWGEQHRVDHTGGAHYDELAELSKKVCQGAERSMPGGASWRMVLHEEVSEAFAETDPDQLRAELVQVAAVAVAWVEDLDSRKAAGDA